MDKTSKKALIVDNDFFFVEFLAEVFQKKGYETVKAYDGKEGSIESIFARIVYPIGTTKYLCDNESIFARSAVSGIR